MAAVLARRTCAVLAVGSAGLHAAMVGHASSPVAAGLLALMLVACLYCAVDLWRQGTVRALVIVALMNLAMIALHLPAPGHHHAAHLSDTSALMTAATALALVEVLAVTAMLYVHSRRHSPLLSGRPDR